ncbi:hypothetical protein AVEN_90238-1, partial [Araneus ventricosus]
MKRLGGRHDEDVMNRRSPLSRLKDPKIAAIKMKRPKGRHDEDNDRKVAMINIKRPECRHDRDVKTQ